jgi:hypothetical protein
MSRTSGTQSALSVTVNQDALAQANEALTIQGKQAQRLMAAYNVTHANPDALEAEIRGYQQTAVESMFAIGARLLVMRTVTDHGDWIKRLERLSMAPRAAQRVMQATLKFADPSKPRDKLLQLGRGRLIELLTLDDEELDVLQDGGDVMELDLDEIAGMSTTELRATLREARAERDAARKLAKKRADEIDRLQERAEHAFVPQAGSAAQTEAEHAQFLELQQTHIEALALVRRLAVVVRDIRASADGCSEAMGLSATQAMQHLCQAVADICAENAIGVDFEEMVTPAWMQTPADTKGRRRKA